MQPGAKIFQTIISFFLLQILNLGRGGGCGKPGSWRLGAEQDVTASGGCDALGLKTPKTEFEIVKLDKMIDLQGGGRDGGSSDGDGGEKRRGYDGIGDHGETEKILGSKTVDAVIKYILFPWFQK